jgi:signal transduction histidine kinase
MNGPSRPTGARERLGRLPLRVRLVAGFLAAMLVLLTLAGAFVYRRVEYALDRGLDTELSRATTTITPLVGPSGRVRSTTAANATGAGWQVLDEDARVLAVGGPAPATPIVTAHDLTRVGHDTRTLDIGRVLPATARPYRVHVTAVPTVRGRPPQYLVVGVRRDHRDEALRELLLQLSLAGLGSLLVAALVGDALARAALRPVERYRRGAEDIAGGADGLRLDVPPGRDDEVTRLGHTLNDMLATLERALDHERRFVNDASHELRTPLTLLSSRIQLARRRSRSTGEHEAVLDELAVDVARLAALADQLLALGTGDPAHGEADAGRVVATVVEDRRLARPDEAHQLTAELPAGPLPVAVDALALHRVVTNLVENAYLHGRPPVRIGVAPAADTADVPGAVGTGGGWVLVRVEDAGSGMAPDLLAEATDRFTRSAEARARPGAGLGLALVAQVVTGAGGELRLCHAGQHTSRGRPVPVPCTHGPAMVASVFLPVEQSTPPT